MIDDQIEIRDGYWWPKYDRGCWNFLRKRIDVPKIISNHANQKKAMIQAGGNAGLYTVIYSQIFQTVYTFEPDHLNFSCLTRNTGPNVIKMQACLGDRHQSVNLAENVGYYKNSLQPKPNCGSHYISGTGVVPVICIDDLVLETCDLIHLDIEGFEGPALVGAERTIREHQPIVAIEMSGHGEKFGWSDAKVENLLQSWGYYKKDIVFEDHIFLPKKKYV